MAGKGGARPGAGRKPTAERYESQIRKAEKRIADRLPELVDNLLRLATGVVVQDVDVESGEVLVYSKPPDYKANEYLLNRIMGKPTERQEVTGQDGGPVEVNVSDARERLLERITRRATAASAGPDQPGDPGT
jgi:hypothetical protein